MAQKPRVIFIVEKIYAAGGAERQAVSIIQKLRDLGCGAKIVTSVLLKEWKNRRKTSVEGVVYIPRIRGEAGRVLWFLCVVFVMAVRVRKFDIIHAHISGYPAFAAAAAAVLLGKKSLIKVACGGFHGDVKHLLGDTPFWRVKRRLFKRADMFIAVSEEIREELLEIGIAAGKINIIRNGVDLARFRVPSASEKETAKKAAGLNGLFVVAYVGRLVFYKDLDTFADVCSRLSAVIPHAAFYVVGAGPDLMTLKNRMKSFQESCRVVFSGEVDDTRPHYWASDVLVHTSLSEGCPNTVLEAMACGIPVVCTNIGGTRDIVRDGETGLLAPARDSEALKANVELIYNDPSIRQRLSMNARSYVEQNHDINAVVRSYIKLYEGLAEG